MERQLFSKYPSIELSDKDFVVNKIRNHGYEHIKYAITEKIHGSNTQITYDCVTGEFEYAKRSCPLEEGEHCYNVQQCFENLKGNVIDLVKYLTPTLPKELDAVKVFGEIFGGSYPHPDVKRNVHASRVQKGVFYSPDNHWSAFDIAYRLKGDETFTFLGASDFFLACDVCNIPTVPLLKVANNLTEALEYPNNGSSVVYKNYNLPEITSEENIMEGVVIRPFDKDLWMGQSRVILKNKNDHFKEKSHVVRPEVTQNYSENLNNALAEAATYITVNRVNNVISHEGEVTENDIGRLIGLVAKDALDEYLQESKTYPLLEKPECGIVKKMFARQFAGLVRQEVYRRLSEECKA